MPKIRTPLTLYESEDIVEAGIDEAGRGCLWGPLTVAVVVLDPDLDQTDPNYLLIQDSKTLTPNQKKKARDYIENYAALYYKVEFASHREIDNHNVLQANMNAMHRALNTMCEEYMNPEKIFVDGNYFIKYKTKDNQTIKHECIEKGDALYANIAAASILAKTHRDEWVEKYCDENKHLDKYKIRSSKGYGTEDHRMAIETHGLDKLHRVSFEPCSTYAMIESGLMDF